MNNEGAEATVQSEIDQNQGFADSDHTRVEVEEDYRKAQEIVSYLTSLKEGISEDQSKTLLSAREFMKRYEGAVSTIRNAISQRTAQ
jgi:hypothetical protein